MKIPNSRGKSLDALLAKLLRLPEGARLTREEADDLVDWLAGRLTACPAGRCRRHRTRCGAPYGPNKVL